MLKEPKGVFEGSPKEHVIDRIFKLVERYPSRSAAARAWGINVNTLKNYYRRQGITPTPRQHQLAKISEVENVSMEWLLNGGDEQVKKPKEPKNTSTGNERLIEIFSVLSNKERSDLIEMLTRKGVETVLYLLDEDNIQLLRMDRVIKDKVLGKYHPKDDAQIDDNVRQGKECGDAQITANTPASLATEKKKAV